jgi:hypothetical protein
VKSPKVQTCASNASKIAQSWRISRYSRKEEILQESFAP